MPSSWFSVVIFHHFWLHMWPVLQQITGLRELHTQIQGSRSRLSRPYWFEDEAEILEPVKTVTRPEKFVVVLPFRVCSTQMDFGESKCVFRLPDDA